MTMLRDRRLAPHPTSTPITAQVIYEQSLRDAETANNAFLAAITGALRRCVSLEWPARAGCGELANRIGFAFRWE